VELGYRSETVAIDDLRPHPRNYRGHPEDQLEHLEASLREHGFYRNIVVARDGTILAGHGVVEAARRLGHEVVPVVRLDLDPGDARALKVLAGDNELGRFAEVDDRGLTDLLRQIADQDLSGLLGTGYDQQMLAGLALITRPESELATIDHAAEWAGLPAFEPFSAPYRVVVSLETPADRDRLLERIGVTVVNRKDRETWSVRWPPREKEDIGSLRFEPGADGG